MRPYVVFIIEKNAPPLSGGNFQWPIFCTSLVIQKISQSIDQDVFMVSNVRQRTCDVFVVGEFMFFCSFRFVERQMSIFTYLVLI